MLVRGFPVCVVHFWQLVGLIFILLQSHSAHHSTHCYELSKHRCGSGWTGIFLLPNILIARSPSSRWCDVILLLLFIYRRLTRAHTSTEKSHLDQTPHSSFCPLFLLWQLLLHFTHSFAQRNNLNDLNRPNADLEDLFGFCGQNLRFLESIFFTNHFCFLHSFSQLLHKNIQHFSESFRRIITNTTEWPSSKCVGMS